MSQHPWGRVLGELLCSESQQASSSGSGALVLHAALGKDTLPMAEKAITCPKRSL